MERADERPVPMTIKSTTLQEESWIHLKHTWKGANIHEKVILTINSTLQTSVLIIWNYFYIHSANGLAQENSLTAITYLFPQGKGKVINIKCNFFTDTQQLEGGSSDLLFWAVLFVLTVSPPFPYSHSAFCMAAMSIIPNLFAHWLGKLKQSANNFSKKVVFFCDVNKTRVNFWTWETGQFWTFQLHLTIVGIIVLIVSKILF